MRKLSKSRGETFGIIAGNQKMKMAQKVFSFIVKLFQNLLQEPEKIHCCMMLHAFGHQEVCLVLVSAWGSRIPSTFHWPSLGRASYHWIYIAHAR